jgi:hypothetical protein
MAAYRGSKDRSAEAPAGRWLLASGAAILLLVAFSSVTTFSSQWLGRGVASATAGDSLHDSIALSPRTDATNASGWLQEFLRRNASTGSARLDPQKLESPFVVGMQRDLIAAQGDPFLLSLAAGIDEGRLIVKSRSGQIPVLGPPLPRSFLPRPSDLEILGVLQQGAGGSFQSFFAGLFGKARSDKGGMQPADSGNLLEENPFSQAKQTINENSPGDSKSPHQEAKADTPAKKPADPPAEKASPTAAPNVPATGGAPVRPDFILHVAENGSLQSMAAGQASDGAFESVQMGIQKFDLLSFSDAAEFPASIAVADFNGDGIPDVAYYFSPQGLLRFFYGSADGTFEEGLRVTAGLGPRSIAAGDFNGDGKMDIAISSLGTGVLTILYGDAANSYSFKSYWLDSYRDYIAVAGAGNPSLVGMNFGNKGTVLLDFVKEGPPAMVARNFDFTPALNSQVLTSQGNTTQMNGVVLNANFSLNLSNRQNQLANVLSIAAGSNVYAVVGDLFNDGRITIGIGTPHR